MIERKKKKKKKKEISRENRGSTRTISTEKERFRPVVPNSIALERVGRLLPHRYTSLFAFFRCHRFQFRAGQLQNWITFDSLI